MSGGADHTTLMAGLTAPVLDSQSIFRSVLRAMSYPGRRQSLAVETPAPEPLDQATAAICLTLMDVDTPVWLDPRSDNVSVAQHLRFHCGTPLVAAPDDARFAVIAAPEDMPRLAAFDAGSDQYPDRSATLLIQVPSLDRGPAMRLTGPGIKDHAMLFAAGLPAWFRDDWADNGRLFPTGVDVILVCGADVVGLPRGVKAEG